MDNDHKIVICFIAFFVFMVVLITCNILDSTDRVDLSIGGFAVDAAGNVYIYYDMDQTVSVYQNGQFLRDFGQMHDMAARSKRGLRFIITEEDEFWMLEGNTFFAMDLEGHLLRTGPYAQFMEEYDCIRRHDGVYRDAQGNTYEMKGNFLGRTRVVKNDTQEVFSISALSVAARLGKVLAVVGLILTVVVGVRAYWKENRAFG